jgi:hypothetical protein
MTNDLKERLLGIIQELTKEVEILSTEPVYREDLEKEAVGAWLKSLEKDLEQELLLSCNEAKSIGYYPHRFEQMVRSYGALKTCKELLPPQRYGSTISTGLTTLWEKKRLDLSMEAIVIKICYQPLFTLREIQLATQRLKDLGYFINYKQ